MGETPCHIPPGTRVLITGATGFTGAVVTRKLVGAGVIVNAIARHSSNLAPLNDLAINWFRGDVGDRALIAEASADVKYIFHVAAAFREAKSTEADYHRIHVTSTQHLVREAQKNPNFKRYVHISTIGVHGHIEDPACEAALLGLLRKSSFVKLLGSYPAAALSGPEVSENAATVPRALRANGE